MIRIAAEEMFPIEARLVNTVYAAGHGCHPKDVCKEKKALATVQEKNEGRHPIRRQNSIKHMKRELAKANASLRRAGKSMQDQSRGLQNLVRYWGQGKHAEREGMKCSLLFMSMYRVERGMGSILFHAFSTSCQPDRRANRRQRARFR